MFCWLLSVAFIRVISLFGFGLVRVRASCVRGKYNSIFLCSWHIQHSLAQRKRACKPKNNPSTEASAVKLNANEIGITAGEGENRHTEGKKEKLPEKKYAAQANVMRNSKESFFA